MSCPTSSSIIFYRQAGGGHWNPDWRADPKFPRTEEERIRAAKKYNLHPDDYKPYPEDSLDAFGDYPDLPIISGSQRDPYEPFDYPELRRNYGEPLHIDFDMYTAERVDMKRLRKSMLYSWSMFLGVVLGFFVVGYGTRDFASHFPQLPKQYPYNDLWIEKGGDPAKMPIRKNYSFDLEGSTPAPKSHGH